MLWSDPISWFLFSAKEQSKEGNTIFVPIMERIFIEQKKQVFHYLQSKTQKAERNKNINMQVIIGKDKEQ